jgi:hypothetical protein
MLCATGCKFIWCICIKQRHGRCQPTGYKTTQQPLQFLCTFTLFQMVDKDALLLFSNFS